MDRDECKNLVEKYGGRVTGSISGKTNFLILGRDGGESKTEKAREMKVSIISEDDLLNMIATRPGDETTPKKNSTSTPQVLPPASPIKPKPTILTSNNEIEKVKTVLSTPPAKIEKPATDESILMCLLKT